MGEKPKSVRRVVVVDEGERSRAIADGPSPDVRTDPARPGYIATRIWVTDRTPARMQGVRDTLNAPHTLEPPHGGSGCRVVSFPPDASGTGQAGGGGVRATHRGDG